MIPDHKRLNSKQQCSRIINTLRTAEGGIVSHERLIEVLWPNPDTQPLGAENCLSVYVYKLRKNGFPIGNMHGRGYYFDAGRSRD